MNSKACSPSSTGPDGAYFEARIGAFYSLAMLAEAEPRGLPGTKIERVALQRAAEGYPLDDVIIHAKSHDGTAATLEIQVKRSITFSPCDEVFRKVVKQIAQASAKPQFYTEQYELAVATAQTSRKIEGAYQDVLRWARELSDATTFFERLARPGSASADMRAFVETFKTNLRIAQLHPDDETVWRLLRRFQILVFDFNSTGSISEQLSIERATKVLHFEERHQARSLWNVLIQTSLQISASGGDRNRAALMEEASLQPFRFSGYRSYAFACDVLAEASGNALKDINDQISDITLARYERLTAIRESLDQGRYIEIRGDSGTGKSGLLKHCAMQIMREARTVVLSPYRTTKGGWTTMRMALKFEGTAQDLLRELALDGSAIIFIDNLDLFSEEERVTVIDLIRAASKVQGVSIIATARSTFGIDEPSWLPSDALAQLGRAPPILIKDLNKTEIKEIQHALPALAPLLIIGHPAYEVSQTLFRLAYLARKSKEEQMVFSETEMALTWWETVDDIPPKDRRESRRLLVDLLKQSFNSYDPIDTSIHSSHIVDLLVRKGILQDLSNERADFSHDVFREWGIANLLHQDPSAKDLLDINCPGRADVLRGVELASRISLEISDDFSKWKQLLDYFSQENAHHKWRRSILLGLVHSEMAGNLLQDHKLSAFLVNDATILGEIIGTLMAIETIPASDILVNQDVPKQLIPLGLHIPIGPSWNRMIVWLLTVDQKLPEEATLQVIKLYIAWCEGRFGKGSNIPSVLKSLYRWLTKIEATRRFENLDDCAKPFCHSLDHHLQKELESDLRRVFLAFCDRVPQLAMEYLKILGKRRKSDDAIINVLTFGVVLAQVAPQEFADLTAKILIHELHTETLQSHLKKAIERVGHPDKSSKIGDPRLMAYRALNRANPANWTAVQRKNSDITDVEYQYVTPIDETQWLSKLKANQNTGVKPIPKRQEYSTKDSDKIKALLQAVVDGRPELAEKAVSILDSLSINEKLSRSLMRCALAGCVLPKRDAMTLEEESTSRLEHHRQSMVKIVDAELAWHADKQPEPEWPSFSLNSQANEYVNHQRAALWLRASQSLQNPTKQSLLLEIIRFYAEWTAKANEAIAKDSYIVAFHLKEWNNEYFKLVALCIPKLTSEEIEQLALIPIAGLTEEAFFNVLPSFLECVDNAYFHEELEELAAINIRSRLADLLMATNGWKWLQTNNSHSIETQIKPAIASLFFNTCVLFEPPACHFEERGIHRIDPFLPAIEKLIVTGPSLHVAIFFLNLIESVPQAKYTAHILKAANCWLKKFPVDRFFWIDQEIGRRVCEWIEKTKKQPSNPLHTDKTLQQALDQLSGKLIKIGIPEANGLEKLVSSLAT